MIVVYIRMLIWIIRPIKFKLCNIVVRIPGGGVDGMKMGSWESWCLGFYTFLRLFIEVLAVASQFPEAWRFQNWVRDIESSVSFYVQVWMKDDAPSVCSLRLGKRMCATSTKWCFHITIAIKATQTQCQWQIDTKTEENIGIYPCKLWSSIKTHSRNMCKCGIETYAGYSLVYRYAYNNSNNNNNNEPLLDNLQYKYNIIYNPIFHIIDTHSTLLSINHNHQQKPTIIIDSLYFLNLFQPFLFAVQR